MRKKMRWSEQSNGNLCLVDADGMIMARVLKGLDDTYKYQDHEFIDARSAQKFVEKLKMSEVE
jgi:hypothetical protein